MPLIQINNVALHFRDEGPVDKPPILFLHALGASSDMWREQIEKLSFKYRCLALDSFGHGKSGAWTGQLTIEQLADNAAEFLDAIDVGRAHIVGASLGGMIAQALTIRHPDHVDRTILIGTTARMPDPRPWRERASTVRREGLADLAGATMERWFTAAYRDRSTARVDETRVAFEAADPESYASICEAIGAMDLRVGLSTIRSPVLVLAAENDPATPIAMADEIRTAIDDATMIVLPHAAHMMAIESADAVARWIDAFL